jgi:hypothetical protein
MGRIFSCRRLLKIAGTGIVSAASDTMRLYLPPSFFFLVGKIILLFTFTAQ